MFSFASPVCSVLAATPRVFLCPFPTGAPMTPASWGVRRISFGYFCVVQTSALSRRASSCHWLNPRRIRRVNPRLCCLFIVSNIIRVPPRLYALHHTLYTRRDEPLLVSSIPASSLLYYWLFNYIFVLNPPKIFSFFLKFPCLYAPFSNFYPLYWLYHSLNSSMVIIPSALCKP